MKNEHQTGLMHWLFRPVPGHSVAVLRIVMGALLLFESVNYGVFHCLDCAYRDTAYLFKYRYFDWVSLPPIGGVEILMFVMGISSIGVMLGWYYRVSVVVTTACFAWYFLLDAALYLNHYYLTLLFMGILCCIPANRVWALDAKRLGFSPYIGNWSRIWLIVQLEIVLIYAGVVKLNPDWLQLEPLRLWMTSLSANSGPLMQWLTQDAGIAFAAYGVIALHIIGAPLLMFARTRLPVFCLYLVFHTINASVFNIGIFPFMTAAATTLFFAPDWPITLWSRIRGKNGAKVSPNALEPEHDTAKKLNPGLDEFRTSGALKLLITTVVGGWLFIQVVLPTRPLWYPGPVAWNEAGHYLSWRMKLRDKRGTLKYAVTNKKTSELNTRDPFDYLTRRQALKMACNPDLIWQFAQKLEELEISAAKDESVTPEDISIVASTSCSLNTRKRQILIQSVDLTAIERSLPREQWVTELTEPLPKR